MNIVEIMCESFQDVYDIFSTVGIRNNRN